MNNKRTNEKRTWEKPELTVLVRNKPEEAVLAACKGESAGNSQDASAGACEDELCQSCNAQTLS